MKINKGSIVKLSLLGIYLCLFGFMIYKFAYQHIESDTSSELILGKLLAEEGTLLSKNWLYSTELRVLNTNIIYFFVSLFVEDFLLLRTFSTVILMAILFSCAYYCLHSYEKIKQPFFASFLFILPFSSIYNGFILYGMYYVPHIAILLFTLGTIQHIGKRKKGHYIIFVITSIISCFAGMGGLRQLLILYIPLVISHILLYAIYKKEEQKRLTVVSLTYFVCAGIGYVINSAILANIYHFVTYNFMKTKDFSMEGIVNFMNGYIQNFGYYANENLFSLKGIVGVLSLLLCFIFIWLIVLGFKKMEKKDLYYVNTIVFVATSMIIFIGIYSFTTMQYVARYLTPTLILLIVVFLLVISYEPVEKVYKKILIYFICGYFFISSYVVVKDFIVNDWLKGEREVAAYIVEKDINKGYATFWNGNIMTELTNGTIDMYTLDGGTTLDDFTKIESCEWLIATDILNSNSVDPVCYIVSKEEYENSSQSRKKQFEPYKDFENNEYIIYLFKDDAKFKQIVENKQ